MAELIIIRGTQNSGKTTTTGLVYQELLKHCEKKHIFDEIEVNKDSLKYSESPISTIDFTAELTYKNKIIGIISCADYLQLVRDGLNKFIKNNFDIIICCARSINRIGSVYKMIVDEFSENNNIAFEINSVYSDKENEKYNIKRDIVNTIIKKVLELANKI